MSKTLYVFFLMKFIVNYHNNLLQHIIKNKSFTILMMLFNSQVMSDSLPPHGLQHAGLSCFTIPWSLLRFMSVELEMTSNNLIPCSLPKFMSTGSMMPSNHLILCCPLLLPPSIFPSIRVFSNESVL